MAFLMQIVIINNLTLNIHKQLTLFFATELDYVLIYSFAAFVTRCIMIILFKFSGF